MNDNYGTLPRAGWATMVCELHVNNLAASLVFWCELLGFSIAFRRPDEGFVYLEHPAGPQIMLCQRHGRFETGPMLTPLGQGVMMQIYLPNIEDILAAMRARDWPFYLAPRETWRRTGGIESGQREFFVQDPDGYLVMVATSIGERSPSSP